MSMSFGLGANLKLGTSQKLTPQMQQAIRLLQMSSLELEQEVQIQLDKNPMLEREESSDVLDNAESLDSLDNNFESLNNLSSVSDDAGNDSADSYTDTSTSSLVSSSASSSTSGGDDGFADSAKSEDTFDKLLNGSCDDSAIDTDWDNVYTSAPNSLVGSSEEELLGYQGGTTASIQDHIRWQINFKNLSENDNMIADYLIDSMDDSGFISLGIDELYSSLATIASFYQWEEVIEKDEIIAVLHIIQSCEPLGIGARDLKECLMIQLDKLKHDATYYEEAKLLLEHCHYLQSNNITALLNETGLNVEDIEPALALIRTLNPAPGQTFIDAQPDYSLEPANYDIPDVLVSMHHDGAGDEAEIVWDVRLNPDTLPKLKINQEYANLVKRGDDSPDNTYLKENLTDAKLFLRSIEERNQNLLKVATAIVKRQDQFLLHGATAMQPLILREIAEEVGLHESTVSRLTTSKSMLTPQGLFSLKHFFSSSVSGSEGDVSSTAICAMISEFVENENPKKPLSDSAIVKKLNEQGIEIARRTVAKYREQLNIGSSTQRKQRY